MKFIAIILVFTGVTSAWAAGLYSSEDYIICDIEEAAWPGLEVLYPVAPDSFIHCARPSQMLYVMNKYFTSESYRILVTSKDKVASPVVYEGKSYSTLYPHIYGPLAISEVIYSFNIKRNGLGKFELPKILDKNN